MTLGYGTHHQDERRGHRERYNYLARERHTGCGRSGSGECAAGQHQENEVDTCRFNRTKGKGQP
jgi:hypothetical protein